MRSYEKKPFFVQFLIECVGVTIFFKTMCHTSSLNKNLRKFSYGQEEKRGWGNCTIITGYIL